MSDESSRWNRRTFLKGVGVIGTGTALTVLAGCGVPTTAISEPTPSGATGAPVAFEAYHDVTAGQHQSNFNRLHAQGYRIISLSVYGDPGDPRYAAVWVRRGGAAWEAVHGVNSAGYQQFFDTWTGKGYVPVLISATGSASNAVFAAVFEQGIVGPYLSRHAMTSGPATQSGTIQYNEAVAESSHMILRSVAIYGTVEAPRYAAVWHANPGYVKGHPHWADSADSYQTVFDYETQLPGYGLHGYRPAYVALSADQVHCSVFKDDVVGPWRARHGLTAAEYQAEFDQQHAKGFFPICVQGGGSGDQTRYAAIFAQRDIPLARQWTATGTTLPAIAGLDNVMQAFMQANAVRAAQLTVGKNGVIKFARAYTWAEPGYRITQPSDRFLLASCSKMFLEAAVQSLYDANLLYPTTPVYPMLGFSNPLDPLSDQITVQQLLNHRAGYNDSPPSPAPGGSGFDPTYHMREIGLSLTPVRPPMKLDVAAYMYNKYPLDSAPGAEYHYSNYGYLLASVVVEHVAKVPYFDYVKTTLLKPAGIDQVSLSATAADQWPPSQAIAEDQGLHPGALNPNSPQLVPDVYGGDGEINEVGAACAGIAASATAMVQFIHRHAVYNNGPREPGASRSGSTPGTSTLAQSMENGVDWAYTLNTRDWPPPRPTPDPVLNDLDDKIGGILKYAQIE
ncbi:MAG TPA: serine hydrolase [Ktedonobacterales bacterium]|nr:serine hydrolase [Ktedonobacterales bacterium]